MPNAPRAMPIGGWPEMTVLIIFATVEGQTRKIAQFADEEVRKAGHDVVLVDASDKRAAVSFDGIDKVILAAPVHERRHPATFEAFLAANRHMLEHCDTLVISVSLSAAFPEGLEEAADYVTEMKMRTGFSPDAEALVAGAVKSSSYDYFAAQVMRHVVLRGRDYDPSQGDREFTDWNALAATLSKFLA
jgi:menaquinone-dependent protoporphyrinogen oxidase